MPIKLNDVEQGSPEWLASRVGKFTGSNAHKLLKWGAIKHSQAVPDEFSGNFYTKRGHILEIEALELYDRIKGVKTQTTGFVTNTKFKQCLYSPDGLLQDRILEVKCFGAGKHKEVATYQPIQIVAQVQFGMMICEKKLCDLILYNPELEAKEALIIITIRRSSDVMRNFKRILKGKNG